MDCWLALYDLTPHPVIGVERRDLALDCGPLGRVARRDNLVGGASRFGMETEQANGIIGEMKHTVAQHWRAEICRHGGTLGDCALVEPAFGYPDFEYPTERT